MAVVTEIGERVPERRQFPVEERHDGRLAGVDDRIFVSIVTVHDARLVAGG